MTESLLQVLLWTTLGLALVLLSRRGVRRAFGAGPAFTLWLLPVVLPLASMLPRGIAPVALVQLPAMVVAPHAPGGTVATPGLPWDQVLLVLWLLGAVVAIARLGWHYARLCAGMGRGSAAWLAAVREGVPGIDNRRLRVHAAGPAVLWALPRALVLLPEDFAQRFAGAATRELVLRHEFAHARRGDAWWTLAMEVATALL